MKTLVCAFRVPFLLTLMLVSIHGQQAVKSKTATGRPGLILQDVPAEIDLKARYLFYLHGLIIENEGVRPTSPRFGVYEYQEILDTFKSRGFVVISEARPKGTDPEQYAGKVVEQVRRLLAAGVPPQNITVVGASRGGGIAMITSTRLKNRRVKFAIMAACGDWDVYRKVGIDLWGAILSVYDSKDDMAGTCADFFKKSNGISKKKEVVLKLGLGHGILYRPFKEWVDVVTAWALTK